jgi:glycosyltransferase involved in cell wall biosynthesis
VKILIDARFTRTDHHDGISRYGASLIGAVAKLADVTMLISDPRQLALLPEVPYVLANSPLSPAELLVARTVNRLRPDVVVSPLQTMGTWGRKYALILTLHDLIYYTNPAPPPFLPLPVRALWRLYHLAYWPQRLLLNRADVVATISETTASLIREHALTRRPVHIVGNAPQEAAVVRDPAVEPEKTLLYMGSFMPYKNVETLVAGVARLPHHELHLMSRITDADKRRLAAVAPQANVVFHNGVTDAAYAAILRSATALVTASRDEGFGIPLVEAMSLGIPVVVSDIPIFREIGGDAALFFPADDPDAFAYAVRRLEEAGEWAARSARSVEQAKGFTWRASAEKLLALLSQTVASRPSPARRVRVRRGR